MSKVKVKESVSSPSPVKITQAPKYVFNCGQAEFVLEVRPKAIIIVTPDYDPTLSQTLEVFARISEYVKSEQKTKKVVFVTNEWYCDGGVDGEYWN